MPFGRVRKGVFAVSSYLLPDDLVTMAQRVISKNVGAGRRVVVAESCTGGLVTAALTEIAGSSAVLDRGFVVYSDDSKHQQLGVARDIIDTFGAVSVAVAWAMAIGALQRSDADVAVAVTGIAGPHGGTEQKPVGLVVFAVALRGAEPDDCQTDTRLFAAGATRADVRHQAALLALEKLLP